MIPMDEFHKIDFSSDPLVELAKKCMNPVDNSLGFSKLLGSGWGRTGHYKTGRRTGEEMDALYEFNYEYIYSALYKENPDNVMSMTVNHWAQGRLAEMFVKVLIDSKIGIVRENLTKEFCIFAALNLVLDDNIYYFTETKTELLDNFMNDYFYDYAFESTHLDYAYNFNDDISRYESRTKNVAHILSYYDILGRDDVLHDFVFHESPENKDNIILFIMVRLHLISKQYEDYWTQIIEKVNDINLEIVWGEDSQKQLEEEVNQLKENINKLILDNNEEE